MTQTLDEKAQGTTLMETLELLWRRRNLLLACLAGVLTPIIIVNLIQQPVYEAQTAIIFEATSEPLPMFNLAEGFSRKSYIINQIEEIKTRSLAQAVVERLRSELADHLLSSKQRSLSPLARQQVFENRIKKNITAEPVRDSDVIIIKFQAPTPRLRPRSPIWWPRR